MKTGKNISYIIRISYFIISTIGFSILPFLLQSCSDTEKKFQPGSNPETQLNSFGFASDSLEHQSYSVKKNETLSDILLNLGITTNDIPKIIDQASKVLNVRKIVAGNIYHSYLKADSTNKLEFLVYENSPRNFVVFDLRDSVNVYESQKEVVAIEAQKSAIIDQSLYVSLMESNASPELAIKLSQIFAWQIDFYHLQKGDNFKVIYEELYVDGELFAIGKIKAAYFHNNGKEYYAIPFTQDSVFQYFDENGNSLRKAFLKAPLEFGRISSRYSKSRLHPVLKTRRPHLGVDYAAPIGTPVRTTGNGQIIEIGYNKGAGKFIKIKHNSMYTTMYLHLSKYAKGIKRGTKVNQGEVIGFVGSTGLSTGPHLDYRFFINGSPVDPLKVELPPSNPIKKELKDAFSIQCDSLINLLNKVEFVIIEKPV